MLPILMTRRFLRFAKISMTPSSNSGRHDDFGVLGGHRFGGGPVQRAVDGDASAESGDPVGHVGLVVCVCQRFRKRPPRRDCYA